MSFWRRISPRHAVADFAHEWQQPNPYRWRVLGVSIAATFAILMVFIPEDQRAAPPRPKVTWITTYGPDRTDAEIIASNIANQQRQDEIRAQQAARAELRKELYRELGRATGLDVDAMEAKIARERAAEEAAARNGSQTAAAPAALATPQAAE